MPQTASPPQSCPLRIREDRAHPVYNCETNEPNIAWHVRHSLSDPFTVDDVQYVHTKVAAKNAGVTHDYVSRLARNDAIKGSKVGTTWYVSEASLAEYLGGVEADKERRWQALSETLRAEHLERAHPQNTPPPIALDRALFPQSKKRRPRAHIFATSILTFTFLLSSALAYEMVAPPGSETRNSLTREFSSAHHQLAAAASLPWFDNIVGNIFTTVCAVFHNCPTPAIAFAPPSPSAQPVAQAVEEIKPPTHAAPATTTIVRQYVTKPVETRVVERIVEHAAAIVQTSGVTLADLATLRTELLAKIATGPTPAFTPPQVAAGGTTVIYVVTGNSGLTSTTTRTVIISAPANDNPATSAPTAANDNIPPQELPATGTE